jgi:predicted dehydrogenase
MELWKHVFVEKPLCHNNWQSRTLKKAAKHYGVVSQMGNQGHTTNGIRLVKEWYDMGLLGQVKEVHAWQPPLNSSKAGSFVPSTSFPPEVQAI